MHLLKRLTVAYIRIVSKYLIHGDCTAHLPQLKSPLDLI